MFDQTIGIIVTVAGSSVGVAIYIHKLVSAIDHRNSKIFIEHGLRLQRLELKVFGFTQTVPKREDIPVEHYNG